MRQSERSEKLSLHHRQGVTWSSKCCSFLDDVFMHIIIIIVVYIYFFKVYSQSLIKNICPHNNISPLMMCILALVSIFPHQKLNSCIKWLQQLTNNNNPINSQWTKSSPTLLFSHSRSHFTLKYVTRKGKKIYLFHASSFLNIHFFFSLSM